MYVYSSATQDVFLALATRVLIVLRNSCLDRTLRLWRRPPSTTHGEVGKFLHCTVTAPRVHSQNICLETVVCCCGSVASAHRQETATAFRSFLFAE